VDETKANPLLQLLPKKLIIMNVEEFTLNPEVVNIIDDLQTFFAHRDFVVSDVIDDDGHQYVDLVQEGGGILGVALLGYTYVLEQMGLRFLNIGGTSAGAINSILVAACDIPEKTKTEGLLTLLANKDLNDFVDGDSDSREFIDTLTSKKLNIWKLIFKGSQVIDNFKRDLALNPGIKFHKWLKNVLDDFGVHNTKDLIERMNKLPTSIRFRENRRDLTANSDVVIKCDLAIIAAEVNTETKVEFPRMRALFYKDPDNAHPADYVRASMSVPLFFKPFELTDLPNTKDSILDWKRIASHRGGVPEKAIFVDGGIMSNFPIDLFHRVGAPTRPTLGVKLGLERVKNKNVDTIGELLFGCFDAARNLRDFEFIYKNPDYKNLVSFVDIKEHNWLDFDVTDAIKVDLFVQGAKAAKEFLKTFDWNEYKNLRKSIRGTVYTEELMEELNLSLKKIIEDKKQDVADHDVAALEQRIKSLGSKLKLKALWIDDQPELVVSEVSMLNKMGIETKLVTSTDDAKGILESNRSDFDFVISDVARNQNLNAGIEFTEWLSNVYPNFTQKVIFYIYNFDLSRGVPPYAFGITSSSVELVHLIMDLNKRID